MAKQGSLKRRQAGVIALVPHHRQVASLKGPPPFSSRRCLIILGGGSLLDLRMQQLPDFTNNCDLKRLSFVTVKDQLHQVFLFSLSKKGHYGRFSIYPPIVFGLNLTHLEQSLLTIN